MLQVHGKSDRVPWMLYGQECSSNDIDILWLSLPRFITYPTCILYVISLFLGPTAELPVIVPGGQCEVLKRGLRANYYGVALDRWMLPPRGKRVMLVCYACPSKLENLIHALEG